MRSIKNSTKMRLVHIPSGVFVMGSPPDEEYRAENEVQHEVVLTKAFHLSETTVTQRQWAALMGEDSRVFLHSRAHRFGRLPIVNVSWHEAGDFCQQLSDKEGRHYRLPTEAEWEYACRAGTTTAFNTGEFTEKHGTFDYRRIVIESHPGRFVHWPTGSDYDASLPKKQHSCP